MLNLKCRVSHFLSLLLHRWFPQTSYHNSPRDVCGIAGKQCDSELHCIQQQWFANEHSLAEGWGGAVWCRGPKLRQVPGGRADLHHCASPPERQLHWWGALPVRGLQSLWRQLFQQGQAYCQWWGCLSKTVINDCLLGFAVCYAASALKLAGLQGFFFFLDASTLAKNWVSTPSPVPAGKAARLLFLFEALPHIHVTNAPETVVTDKKTIDPLWKKHM